MANGSGTRRTIMAPAVHMTSNPPRWRTVVIWTLRCLLAAAFLYIGTTKLTGTGNTVEFFAAIGWGQWFRYLTGLLDFVGVSLIFVPRLTFYGAIVLVSSVGTATLILFTVLANDPIWGNTAMKLVPLTLTVLAVALAFFCRWHQQGSG